MTTIKLFRTVQKYANINPLPKRNALLRRLVMWSLLALVCAFEIGILVGKSWWRTPFTAQGVSKWVPVFLLLASLLQVKAHLEFLLDGAFQGGKVDQDRTPDASAILPQL